MSEPPSSAPLPAPSDRPILAFFDVDNTLMRGTSLFQLGREAWAKRVIRFRDVALFAWHQRRFIQVGENDEHLATARERALGLVGGHTQTEILELAESIWEHRIKPRLYPETVDLTQEHVAKGHEVWLVSATPWEIGDLIARRLGPDRSARHAHRGGRRRLHRRTDRPRAAQRAQGRRGARVGRGERRRPGGQLGVLGQPQRHPAARTGRASGRGEPGRDPRASRPAARLAGAQAATGEHPRGAAAGAARGASGQEEHGQEKRGAEEHKKERP